MAEKPMIEVWLAEHAATLQALGYGAAASEGPEARVTGAMPPAATPRDAELGVRRKAFNDAAPPSTFKVNKVPLPDLLENLKGTLAQFQETLDALPKPRAGYAIDEIELHFGVNGSGGVALIGKMEVGMEAAITVKIKRTP